GAVASRASLPEHSAQIGFENRGRLLELFAKAREVLQLADGFFGLTHALGSRIHLAAEEVGVLTVDGHLRQRLNLSFDAIQFDGYKLRVLLRTGKVVQAEFPHRDAVLQ